MDQKSTHVLNLKNYSSHGALTACQWLRFMGYDVI